MTSAEARNEVPRGLLLLAALAYTVFVIYGSLVPLEFRAISWDEAVARFGAIRFLNLGIGSRADWVANLLLFIPLTYLWMGVLVAGRGSLATAMATLLLIPLAVALSLSIEFTQLFFPQRTVSQNDIFAETVGGVIGVVAWWGTGRRFVEWLTGWQRFHSRAALAERFAWVYLAGLLAYNVLPLDLTISVVEIFHKFQEGKLKLIPFGRLPADPAYAIYEVATDALIWVPLALLWRLDGTRSAWRVWGMAMAAAVGLEAMQLFVFSRVSDVTDLFTAAIGAALGTLVGGRLAKRDAPAARPLPWGAWLPFALAAAWGGVLMFVFWFPFDFRVDGAFIKSRLDFMDRVPFEAYYFGTEFRAITEVLRKMLFFAPLGGLLAWGVARQPWRWRTPLFALSMLALALVPAAIELGQLMLPHKIVDMTDWLLAWVGGAIGYGTMRYMVRAPSYALVGKSGTGAVARDWDRRRWHLPIMVGGLMLLFWVAAHLPFIPYNVRELLRPEATWLSALLLALACVWLAIWPVWIARRRVSSHARFWQLPFGLLVYGAVSILLLFGAVPKESLYDLMGTPILGWAESLELALRWLALAAVPGILLYLAVQTIRSWRGRRLGILHFLIALPLLALAYWGVVLQAATDNLTELIAEPKILGFAALCAWLYVIFLTAGVLASPIEKHHGIVKWMALLISLPLAALFLQLGFADQIDKYGQHFAALQFLLSVDRHHYAAVHIVWLRYIALHFFVIGALILIQWPYFRASHQHHTKSSNAPH